MSSDDDSTRRGRTGLGQGLPGVGALTEVFGAAVGGASRMTRTRAKQLAERLLSQAGLENVDLSEAASEAGARINQLADEILAARKANRALLQRTVAGELEKSLGRLGLARAEDVQQLRDELSRLRAEVADLLTGAGSDAGTAASAPSATAAGGAAATKASTAKKAARPASPRTTTGTTAKKAPVRTSTTRKTPAKSPTAKKTTGGTARTTASSRQTGGSQR